LFLELVQEIRIQLARDGSWTVPPGDHELITDWCAKHGLLGAPLQAAQCVTLAAQWEPCFDPTSHCEPEGTRHPTQWRFIRQSGRWVRAGSQNPHASAAPGTGVRLGQLADEADIPQNWRRPGILWQDLRGLGGWREDTLSWYWSRFFPDVPEFDWARYRYQRIDTEPEAGVKAFRQSAGESFQYPFPGEPRFRNLYAEPVADFLDAALVLRDALAGLNRIESYRGRPDVDPKAEDMGAIAGGVTLLNALAEPVSVMIEPVDDGTYRKRWVAPSLLASFAMMALQDLTQGRHVLVCASCGRLIVRDVRTTQYCSSRCRKTSQMQRYRQRQRQDGRLEP
jgi:hypothetical protein